MFPLSPIQDIYVMFYQKHKICGLELQGAILVSRLSHWLMAARGERVINNTSSSLLMLFSLSSFSASQSSNYSIVPMRLDEPRSRPNPFWKMLNGEVLESYQRPHWLPFWSLDDWWSVAFNFIKYISFLSAQWSEGSTFNFWLYRRIFL